jgi:IstB-like ATP binding protein
MGHDILRLLLRPEGGKARHLQAHAAAKRFNGPIIFNGDSTITSAVLGRLLHHAETIIIEGSSYRMKDRTETQSLKIYAFPRQKGLLHRFSNRRIYRIFSPSRAVADRVVETSVSEYFALGRDRPHKII